jgi:general secretion pathway protein J
MKPPSPKEIIKPRGFTLLEILVAIFIFVIVLSTIYASYTGTLRIVDETESQAEIYQMARIAFERMSEDLESLYIRQDALASPVGPAEVDDAEAPSEFKGELNELEGRSADTLRFLSRAHLVFGEQDLPSETAEITYYVEEDVEGESFILYRRDRLQVDEEPEESGGGLPLCEGLFSVSFRYYDDKGEENDSWDSGEKGFPRIVSLSLEFVNPSDPEAPLKFATSVALPSSQV